MFYWILLTIIIFQNSALANTKSNLSEIKKIEFSSKQINWNSKNNSTSDLKVDIPANAISFTVYAFSNDLSSDYQMSSLKNPAGKASEFNYNQPISGGYFGFMMPWKPGQILTSGRWVFSIKGNSRNNSKKVTPPKIIVLIKTVNGTLGPHTRGRLSVSFQFSGSDQLTASSARTDLVFQKHLAELTHIFKSNGIDLVLSDESYNDLKIPGNSVEIGYNSDQVYASGKRQDAINIIFASAILLPQGSCKGLSAAILGPFLIKSSNNSVVMATSKLNLTPLEEKYEKSYASTLAHEIAHYLGLPHISDPNFGVADQFNDTKDFDLENLMYYDDATPSKKNLLSPQQRHFLLLNPMVTLY